MVKILGLEIKKSTTKHADINTAPSTQKTKPSLPLKKAKPRDELGDSGTRTTRGIIAEEYNPNLQGVQAIRVYDEMRKGDGTVRASMLVTTLPIRRAKWFVKPATEDDKDKEIAEFVQHNLFDWLEDMTWDDVVRQALLMLPFGVMLFEKVYGLKDYDGKSYVIVKKLAPRLPQSIQQWELVDGTFGIQQLRQDGEQAQIPGSKLLIFVNEKEGDNWWGTSMLRAAYKHWYYKNNFYKIDAIAFERQGVGIPLIKMPKGYTESDERKAITAASNLRSNEKGYLILPPDYEAEMMDMGAGSTRDPERSINHHNKEILQSVLAQFLELGQTSTGGGSRALSEDHSDLFLNAMEAIANNIASEVSIDLIRELVDMNFDGVTVYPTLEFSGISRVDVKAIADSFKVLVDAKGMTPTNKDERYFRNLLGLPEITDEEIDAELETEMPENPDTTNANKVNNPDMETGDPAEEDTKTLDKKIEAKDKVKKIRNFEDTPFKAWRTLSFTEKKVNFPNIQERMNTLEDKFTKEATELLNNAKDTFISKLQVALDNGDTKAVADLEIKFVNDYKALLKAYMKDAYVYGKNNASSEMDVQTPPNSADTLASIDLLADTIAWKAASDIESQAKTSAVNGLKKLSEKSAKFASVIQVVGMIDALLEDKVSKIVKSAAGLVISQAINMGRKDVFDRNKEEIHALQRSEILDEVTCDFCLSMDGRVIDVNDKWANEDCFHTNCRGIWVEILKEEPNPPEIDGIPNNLADYYGGEPNSLVQPARPIVKPDSLAQEEVKRRADEKKNK